MPLPTTQILELPVAVSLDGSEYAPLVQGGVTKRAQTSLFDISGAGGGPQTANTVYAGPTTGATANPTFRSLVSADIPNALTLGVAGTALGSLILSGNTSGAVTIAPQAAAGTFNFNLPTTAGTSGYVLTSGGGGSSPMTWTDPASLGIDLDVGTTVITNGTTTRVLYDNAGVLGEYAISGSGSVAMTTSPSFTTPALGTPSAGVLSNCTGYPAAAVASGAAITRVDDTNVTLTLGGTPASALLTAVSITAGWSGQLAVARGGTGAATFTTNGVLYGNSTSAIQVTSQGAANSVLTANAGAPSFSAAPTIGTSVTTPIVYGGSAAGSTLSLRSTSSGAPSADAVSIYSVGIERANFGTSLVINESGADFDVRMEGDTLTHMFFLDASADCIGIGDSAPTARLSLLTPSTAGPHFDAVADNNSQYPDISSTGYGATTGGGTFHTRFARGSRSSPTQVLASDQLGGMGGRPYTNAGSFTSSSPVAFHFYSAEDQTSTGNGAYMQFFTTPIGSTFSARKTRLYLTQNGTMWGVDTGTYNPLSTSQTKPATDTIFVASAEDAASSTGSSFGAVIYGGSSSRSAGFRGFNARGTAASPTATQADDLLAFLGGHGYDTTTPGWSSSSRGLFGVRAAEAYTNTAQGTYLTLETTPTGSTTRAERARVTDVAITSLVNVIAPNLQQQVRISSVNFNSANTDNAVTVVLPTGFSRFRIGGIAISGASATLTTATFGVFTATAGGGTAVIAGATAVTVSSTSESTTNNMQFVTPANVNTASYNNTTLYFRVQTAQGSAATASVTIFYQPVS